MEAFTATAVWHSPHVGKGTTCSWGAPLISPGFFPLLTAMNTCSNHRSNILCCHLKPRDAGDSIRKDDYLTWALRKVSGYRASLLSSWLRLFNVTGLMIWVISPTSAPPAAGCFHPQARLPCSPPCQQPGILATVLLHSKKERWDDFPTLAVVCSTCQAAWFKAPKRPAEVYYSAARAPLTQKETFTVHTGTEQL